MLSVLLRLCLLLLACAVHAGPSVVEPANWNGQPAFRLTDGRCEAVVVPVLGGRVIRFAEVGGENWLWTGTVEQQAGSKTQFWGGDKTYFGPHSLWRFTMPATWPPPAPDSSPHAAEILPEGKLKVTSPLWDTVGAAIERVFGFADGEFVVEHLAAPVPGSRQPGALWTISQVIPTEAVYVPLDPQSPYKDNAFWYGQANAAMARATALFPDLLRITPTEGTVWKLGAAPPLPALAAVKGNKIFMQRAEPQKGTYPGGPDRGGFSVEVYHHNLPGPGQYTELEFLSPLRRFDEGMVLTTRWKVHTLSAPVSDEALRGLLRAEVVAPRP